MANFIGKENILKHVGRFQNITKIEVLDKETAKRAVLICSLAYGNPVEILTDFLDQQAEQENNYQGYYCKVFLKGDNTKNAGTDFIGFTFAINERQQSRSIAVNGAGSGAYAGGNFNQDKIYDLYQKSGYLEAENARLHAENNDLLEQLQEYEAQETENEITGIEAADPLAKFKPYIELLKECQPLIQGLFSNNKSEVMIGAGNNGLNNLVAECSMLDPNFENVLKKYLSDVKQARAAADQSGTN